MVYQRRLTRSPWPFWGTAVASVVALLVMGAISWHMSGFRLAESRWFNVPMRSSMTDAKDLPAEVNANVSQRGLPELHHPKHRLPSRTALAIS
ncbi:unnamed protein product [Durusdinium trenchii]|uniref:Uncharacterized protein n=1 Tax=Durusdinium trenchii TaxID=1381693 RepID=A0ABP0SEL0_9DINO